MKKRLFFFSIIASLFFIQINTTSVFAEEEVHQDFDVECHCEMAVILLTKAGVDNIKAGKPAGDGNVANLTLYQYREEDKKSFKKFVYLFQDQDQFYPVKWAEIEFARALNQSDSAVERVSAGVYKLKEKNIEVYAWPWEYLKELSDPLPEGIMSGVSSITIDDKEGKEIQYACFPKGIENSSLPVINDEGQYLRLYMKCASLKFNPDTTERPGFGDSGSGAGTDGEGGGGGCYLGVCNLNQLGGGSGGGGTDLPKLIGRALSGLTGIIGAVALAVFVYGGFLWMLSMGSPERIKKAQALLLWGGLGTMVIVASYAIVTFLFDIF